VSSAVWEEPPWASPLDFAARLKAIPADATITGLFLSGVRDLARASDVKLERARPSYVAFKHYPLREHAELMLECADRVWPALPLRQALRKMGRGGAGVLIASHVGRVVFGSAEGPLELVRAMARSYGLHVRPGTAEVEPDGERRIVVRMRDIHYFLDSHHVGVFEGVLRHGKVEGTVQLASRSTSDADFLLSWR
jgi:uncharacterized protein (TIGR02265 family)